jgi:ParB family chromosome partitioning protein
MKRSGLGRGLGALIQDSVAGSSTGDERPGGGGPMSVPTAAIRENPLQPRHIFGEQALQELTASVRERGILQPLLVRRVEGGYELIAGERRLRAARACGLTAVPVLVHDAPDTESLELALVENLQREDLNILEEAQGYRALADTFGLTQEQIALKVGKARASVANALRLLALPPAVRELVTAGALSAGHAKVLTGVEIPDEQTFFARLAVDESLSVRNLEERIARAHRAPRKPRAQRSDLPADHLRYLSDRLHERFGTSVRLAPSRTYANGKKGKGRIEIDFYSNDELDRILHILGVHEEQ